MDPMSANLRSVVLRLVIGGFKVDESEAGEYKASELEVIGSDGHMGGDRGGVCPPSGLKNGRPAFPNGLTSLLILANFDLISHN